MQQYESVSLTYQVNGWKRNRCLACRKFTKNDPEGFVCKCGQGYLADPDTEGNYLVVPRV
jgi:hypothetical protein